MSNKTLCIIQARMGATRLPNKVLKKVDKVSLLEREINRIKQAQRIDKIVVATSINKENNKIEKLCQEIKIDCFRGSEDDVLDRFYQCLLKYNKYNNIIRATGDCPLIDPRIIDELIEYFEKGKYDYANNVKLNEETYPDGMDIEIFKREALVEAAQKATLKSDREHVTLFIRTNKKFSKGYIKADQDWSHFRLTVDTPDDFKVIKFLIKNTKPDAGMLDYISLLTKNPQIMFKNMHITRNIGLAKSLKKDFGKKIILHEK